MIGRHVILGARQPDLAGHKLAKGTIPRALKMAVQYRARLVTYLGLIIVGALLSNAPPLLLRALVNDALPGRDRGMVVLLALLGLGVALADAGVSLATTWVSSRIGEGIIFDLRVALFDHVQRLPVAFFTRTQTGSLISRLNNDVIGAHQAFTRTLGTVVSNGVGVTTTLLLMLALDWRLTLLSLAIVPAFAIPAKRGGRALQRLMRERMDVNAEMHTTMQERFNVAGAMLAKLFGAARRESELFSGRARRVGEAGVKITVRASLLGITLSFVSALGVAVAFLVGGNLVLSDPTFRIGDLVAFLALLRLLYTPLAQLASARADLMSSFVSFERVFEVLDLAPAVADAAEASALQTVRGRIEFRDVRFRYPGADEVSLASLEHTATMPGDEGTEVLRGMSFVAEPGTTTALVGPSGGGKTTIVNLIPRLYDVTAGAVLIDGIDVRQIEQESLRAHIGVVTQDAHLFHDTVGANLRYARPDATDDEIWEACEAAEIAALIRSLPVGLDTVVGERGYRLSGGEKQRLAIARVLLKAPAIVLLDEATAHLDSESEALIQKALARALAGRTAVVIAHRLSTIVHADQILVVEGGRIVERGRHTDLAAAGGLYSSLYATQFATTQA